ncbi:MAG: VOC family protein [Rhodospirillaceae bacterium]|nr:VOC family protein [Rhodospirillaceae bacterium]MBT4427881.1 VOC family protein [Rhodospirillaceae bacterium]MBT5038548.1 VOC family protein [Rhodospirillaceae bacterium]MBT5677717.1 VOC family protein [Rhodospirillaceae bacterium]MBT5781401.1 VOC family protein [Rhodospirillaceae bacterium]
MYLKEINHLAFITPDMEKTIRFYRDLLGMELTAGIGHDGYRHYFFKTGNNYIAFFAYDGAQPMEIKFHGSPSTKPLGFDHLSISVASKEDLFALKDRLEAAGVEVTGAVDHGFIWSIYFFDNNNIPLEASWDFLDIVKTPAIVEDDPLPVAEEGSGPQPGIWPDVTSPTPPEQMTAHPGNGYQMRDEFMRKDLAAPKPEFATEIETEIETDAAD